MYNFLIKAGKQDIVLRNGQFGNTCLHIDLDEGIILPLIEYDHTQFNLCLITQFSNVFLGNISILSIVHMERQNTKSPRMPQIGQIGRVQTAGNPHNAVVGISLAVHLDVLHNGIQPVLSLLIGKIENSW